MGIVVVWVVSVLIFLAARASGDPVIMMADPGASEEELDVIRERYGLNRPLPVQYAWFVVNSLRGDFGESLFEGTSASLLIWQRIPATLELVLAAKLISLVIGITGGGAGGCQPPQVDQERGPHVFAAGPVDA